MAHRYELAGEWYSHLRANDYLRGLSVSGTIRSLPERGTLTGDGIIMDQVMHIQLWDANGAPLYNSAYSLSRLSVQFLWDLGNIDDTVAQGRNWWILGASIPLNVPPCTASTTERFSIFTINAPYSLDLYHYATAGEACANGQWYGNLYTVWIWYNGSYYMARAHFHVSYEP